MKSVREGPIAEAPPQRRFQLAVTAISCERNAMLRRLFLAGLAVSLVLPSAKTYSADAPQNEKAGSRSFVVHRGAYAFSMNRETTLTSLGGVEIKEGRVSELDYRWLNSVNVRELTLERFVSKSSADGKETESREISGKGMWKSVNGVPESLPPELTPFLMEVLLQDSFEGPHYRLEQRGRETRTTILAKDLVKDLIDEELIAQTSLFHPLIPEGKKDGWKSEVAMKLGLGGTVRGTLRYQKVPKRQGAVYEVQGTLKGDPKPLENGKQMVDIRYVFSGEQSYDETAQLWQEGKMTIKANFEIRTAEGDKRAGGTETIVATMKRR